MKVKHILITGASRGIGFHTTLNLVNKGHRVTATARSIELLEKLKGNNPDKINVIKADLTKPEEIASISNYFTTNELRLDGLIHNAGLLINKRFSELTDRNWKDMIDVNLMGPVRLTRSLLDQLNSGSHIVSISSMGGYQESSKFPGLTGYSCTKGALNILTECLAVELSDRNISVNCLSLGAVQTEMLQEAFPGIQAPVKAGDMGEYIAEFILKGHNFFNGKILPVSLSDPE